MIKRPKGGFSVLQASAEIVLLKNEQYRVYYLFFKKSYFICFDSELITPILPHDEGWCNVRAEQIVLLTFPDLP